MKYIFAATCSLVSFFAGTGFMRYLTCHPLQMDLFLLLTCIFVFILVILLFNIYKKRHSFIFYLLLSIIFLITGYLITYHSFTNIDEYKMLPVITREKGSPGLGHTAVIFLAHGEPETYDPSAWLKQMQELDDQQIPFIPYPFRPFFFNSLREKYLLAGKSGHNFECLQLMRQVEEEYRRRGDASTKFYISYLENEPHPDTVTAQALNEGAGSIILCNIFITVSNHTKEGIDRIKPLKLSEYGVAIKYTRSLYDSKTLQKLYVDKLNSTVAASNKKNVGVILVGHGQPIEWDKEFPTETQQEISFRKDILHQLKLDGYNPQNLKLAWMEFREPTPEDAVKQLVANGVKEIYYFSTIIGSESIHAKFDIPSQMNAIPVPPSVKLQQLTAFEDKAGITKALIEKIEETKKNP